MNNLEKGYACDAGTDVIIKKDIVFEPEKLTIVDLEISITPNERELIIVVPRSSAAMKGLFIANSPVDPGYTGHIHAIVYNCSNNKICYKKGEAFAQLVCIPFNDLPCTYHIRKDGARGNGKMGSSNIKEA